MLNVEKVDTTVRRQVERVVNLPHRLYRRHPYWAPALRMDARRYLNRQKFFFYEHSTADFFLAVRDGQDVGCIAVLEHRPFNQYHGVRQAQFYLFDCADDPEAANQLFACACDWAKARGLTKLVGPKGFSVLDGFGILVEGFDQPAVVGFTPYNYPYYSRLLENFGFCKVVDFISGSVSAQTILPPQLQRVASYSQKKSALTVQSLQTMPELLAIAPQILQTYNQSFANNWEFYPLSEREIRFVIDELRPIAIPRLATVVKRQEQLVGFALGLPDLSPAVRRWGGRLHPLSLFDLWRTKRRPQSLILTVMGMIDPEHAQGGAALLMAELERQARSLGITRAEFVNVADTAVQMRRILQALGMQAHKRHRVYEKEL